MKYDNICKFTPAISHESLSVFCFILEKDPSIMKMERLLDCHTAILIIRGNADFFIDGKSESLSAGCLLFGFKNERITATPYNDCEYMYINFDGTRAFELFRRFDIGKNNRCFSMFEGLIPIWKESITRAVDNTIDLLSESILLMTFSRLEAYKNEKNELANKLVGLLDERFTDPELSLSTVANELSYNPKYLSHLFKKQMGTGFSEYLKNLRIKYAVSLFDIGLDSIKNVALLSGFQDPLYFSSVFKKTIGESPKEYINNHIKSK